VGVAGGDVELILDEEGEHGREGGGRVVEDGIGPDMADDGAVVVVKAEAF